MKTTAIIILFVAAVLGDSTTSTTKGPVTNSTKASSAATTAVNVTASVEPATSTKSTATMKTTTKTTTTAGKNTTTAMPTTTAAKNTTTAPKITTTAMPTTTAAKNTTTAPKNTTTAMPTTTAAKNTTTAPKNTTTAMPTTTAAKNATTAPKNTTTALPTTTAAKNTTTAPKNTTTAAPPTTTKPTPSPQFNATIKEKNGTICLQVIAQVKLMVHFKNGTGFSDYTIPLVGGDHFKYNGKCATHNMQYKNDTANIVLTWNTVDLAMKFQGGPDWFVKEIDVNIKDKKIFKSDILSASLKNVSYFGAPKNSAYNCPVDQKLSLDSKDLKSYNITVDFVNLDIQPFAYNGNPPISICPQKNKDTSDSSIVPIAVGCALAGLIVIVLIAYLIGRRKSNSRGYQQV